MVEWLQNAWNREPETGTAAQQLTVKDPPLHLSFYLSHRQKAASLAVQQSSYWGNLPPDTDHYGASQLVGQMAAPRPGFISFYTAKSQTEGKVSILVKGRANRSKKSELCHMNRLWKSQRWTTYLVFHVNGGGMHIFGDRAGCHERHFYHFKCVDNHHHS